jgi:hypothetical protein
MKAFYATFLNNLLMISALHEWRKLNKNFSNPQKVQSDILFSTIKHNIDTEYGRRHKFQAISNYDEYKYNVPLTTYDDYIAEIKSISKGKKNILTKDPVLLFEPTSGSTAPSKLIPYPDRLQKEFIRGILPWIYDLFKFNPDLKNGASYWSISPALKLHNKASGKIPIGFQGDSDYLGKIRGKLINAATAVPNEVKQITDISAFQYVTLLFLLNRSDLRMISIWNPTFLMLLLDNLPKWWDSLIGDLQEGAISFPISSGETSVPVLLSHFHPNLKRAQELSKIYPENFQKIWPALQLISCWDEGHSGFYSKKLISDYFPKAKIQGKGLIATEAFVSFPLYGYEGCVLSINSHFFEFLPLDANGNPDLDDPKCAFELKKGHYYTVVITTGGGFYRYQLNDIVEVCGYLLATPLIKFVGRADYVSDWFGEKLNGQFVTKILNRLLRKWKLEPEFFMLAPEEGPDNFRYVLYMEIEGEKLSPILETMQEDLDTNLRQNVHYDYCRNLKQISLPDICVTQKGAHKRYLMECEARGLRLGNIKTTALQKLAGWKPVFTKS